MLILIVTMIIMIVMKVDMEEMVIIETRVITKETEKIAKSMITTIEITK